MCVVVEDKLQEVVVVRSESLAIGDDQQAGNREDLVGYDRVDVGVVANIVGRCNEQTGDVCIRAGFNSVVVLLGL